MEKDTLKKFRSEVYVPENNSINNWLNKHHKKAIYFIDKLLENKVRLEDININDWNCNTNPSVYVGSGRYSRLAENDYRLAIKRLEK